MNRYNYDNKIGMYADENGDWCRADDTDDKDRRIQELQDRVYEKQQTINNLKCCGNCKYWTWAEIGECNDPDERDELLASDRCTQWKMGGGTGSERND